jgi:hypothetical protein
MRSTETPPHDARSARLANAHEQFDNPSRRTGFVENAPESDLHDTIDQPCRLAPESLRRVRRPKPPRSEA